MKKLSVVLATRNEERNIKDCIDSVKGIADEIIVVDEFSTDKTRDIARKLGAKVYKVKHEPIFHITKQKALDKATGEWILQLDADERVSTKLADEIKKVINLSDIERKNYKIIDKKKRRLFKKHQRLIETRDAKYENNRYEIVAFYLPRINYFLGKPLKHAGVYPDGVIRLIKNGKARFPQKSVHEQIVLDGKVAWLNNDLEHHDSPTLRKYVMRMNRYTDLHANELKEKGVKKNFVSLLIYTTYKPLFAFVKLYFRHKGFLDGMRGFMWSILSAMHFPLAYYKYYSND